MQNLNVEKILQHDPTEQKLDRQETNYEPISINDIDKIPNDTDSYQEIEVKLRIPHHILSKLKKNIDKKFGENNVSVNGYLVRKIDEWNEKDELLYHVGSLSYAGSFPRKDVLLKLHKLALELESWPEFPKFKSNRVKAIIKKVLGRKDPRTFNNYLECIKGFVEYKTGREVFWGDYDFLDFKETIEVALNQHNKTDRN